LLRVGPWLLVCMAACCWGWPRRDTNDGAFALGVCGSATIYVMTYFFIGVASDFRYGYWAVLAGITGAVISVSDWRRRIDPKRAC
jgi:peptidoglycan/LPS O-acetylase OafA/YrhL